MTNPEKKSKAFIKFENDFFSEVDLNKPLSHIIDLWTIDQLDANEKNKAEEMLIEALKTKIDKRWLYGLEELGTDKAYDFLFKLFSKEKNNLIKTKLSYSLVRINSKAPVLEFLQKIIHSNENEQVKLSALSSFYWIKDYEFKDSTDIRDISVSRAISGSSRADQQVVRNNI